MSERQGPEQVARILDLRPASEYATDLAIEIEPGVSGKDVLATLAYNRPKLGDRNRCIRILLKEAIKNGPLQNRKVSLEDPFAPVADHTQEVIEIEFGANPTWEDVSNTMKLFYGEDEPVISVGMQYLFEALVDQGVYNGCVIRGFNMDNEISGAKPDAIKLEMQQLTDKFYGVEGPQD